MASRMSTIKKWVPGQVRVYDNDKADEGATFATNSDTTIADIFLFFFTRRCQSNN